MIYGYARVSTDGQSVDAQVKQLRAVGAEKVFRETASGARPDRAQLHRMLAALGKGDVLMVTRLDRLARSTRDLLNTLAAITGKKAGSRSLGDTWADTTTAHGRLMLTVLGGLAEFERELIRARTGEGRERAKAKGVKMGPKFKLTDHRPRHPRQQTKHAEALSEGGIILHRTDPAKHMRRYYRLDVQPDLFGPWCFIREWGRIGRAGQVRTVPFPTRSRRARGACLAAARQGVPGYCAR